MPEPPNTTFTGLYRLIAFIAVLVWMGFILVNVNADLSDGSELITFIGTGLAFGLALFRPEIAAAVRKATGGK